MGRHLGVHNAHSQPQYQMSTSAINLFTSACHGQPSTNTSKICRSDMKLECTIEIWLADVKQIIQQMHPPGQF